MQAITIAIGKAGVNFFANHYLIDNLIRLLNKLTPPNKTISVPDFKIGVGEWSYDNISIVLNNGSLQNFVPAFQSITQGVTQDAKKTPIFKLAFQARNFSANYNWTENYHWNHDWAVQVEPGQWEKYHQDGNTSTPLSYGPGFDSLTANVVVQFQYISADNAWEITVSGISADTGGEKANIPSKSILQSQVQHCFDHEVDEATAHAVAQIDFATPINNLIHGILQTIPASGDLGDGIKYDFSLGDSGLLFPNNNGIQMGVKGGSSYNGTPFSEKNPPSLSLPLPPADSDSHHLNMYVSNYEIDALNWAYYKAGKLNITVEPKDLDDPNVLAVKNYIAREPALKTYATFAMHAVVEQKAAPVSCFQVVYVYTKAIMEQLQKELPPDIYAAIELLSSNAYLSQNEVESFLKDSDVPQSFFEKIENAGKTMAMVLTQDINFTMIIQGREKPNIKFEVKRVDVLTDLKLGLSSNNTQTLQYGFANATNSVKYIGSSIQKFNGSVFEQDVWPLTAEPLYVKTLRQLGQKGVPLPIMQGFHFVFDHAQISTQKGYVSILADVEFISHKALKAVF